MNQDAHKPRRKRVWIWVIGPTIVVTVAFIPFLFKGRMQPVTAERLEVARAQWHQAHISDYEMEVEVSGTQSGVYQITVRGGDLQHMTRDGQQANPHEGEYWTVEGLFRTIVEELHLPDPMAGGPRPSGGQRALLASFDHRLGYPLKFLVSGRSRSIQIQVHRLVVQ